MFKISPITEDYVIPTNLAIQALEGGIIVECDTSNNPIQITLPFAENYDVPIFIVDGGNNAGSNAITIFCRLGDTIEGDNFVELSTNLNTFVFQSTETKVWSCDEKLPSESEDLELLFEFNAVAIQNMSTNPQQVLPVMTAPGDELTGYYTSFRASFEYIPGAIPFVPSGTLVAGASLYLAVVVLGSTVRICDWVNIDLLNIPPSLAHSTLSDAPFFEDHVLDLITKYGMYVSAEVPYINGDGTLKLKLRATRNFVTK